MKDLQAALLVSSESFKSHQTQSAKLALTSDDIKSVEDQSAATLQRTFDAEA